MGIRAFQNTTGCRRNAAPKVLLLFPRCFPDSRVSFSLLIQPRNDTRQHTRAPDILGFARDLKVTRTLSGFEQL